MDLFPGVIVALGKLRERGVRLGLVTNGDRRQQRRKVEHYGLTSFFDVILIEGEFGSGKPDESVYRHVLEALEAKASDAWMVGDHLEWDVAARQRLGLRGAWIDVEGRGLPADALARPDLILRAFTEIVDLVEARDDGDGASSRAAGRGEPRWN